MNKIVLTDETLTDKNHEVVGWVADDGKFHPLWFCTYYSANERNYFNH